MFTVLTPQLRAKYLEKKHRLKQDLTGLPQDLTTFIHQIAPELQIRVNLKMPIPPFVYPLGYRKAAIAIFKPIILLWESKDKERRHEAEALLLHEIAHYQHGDALVAGEGSFLDIALNWWLLVFLIVGFLPMTIMWTEQAINFMQSTRGSGGAQELMETLTIFVPGGLLILVEELLQTLSLILLPIMAFWCIEFSADQAVLSTVHLSEELINGLAQFHSPKNWIQWLFAMATHPPKDLRSWIARNATTRWVTWLLLMCFPLAVFSYLLEVVPVFILQYSNEVVFPDGANLVRLLAVDVGATLVIVAPLWAVIAIGLLIWPLVRTYWERSFTNLKPEIGIKGQSISWTNYGVYYTCACLAALLALWGCALYLLIQ
jgi:Peptidase family M48